MENLIYKPSLVLTPKCCYLHFAKGMVDVSIVHFESWFLKYCFAIDKVIWDKLALLGDLCKSVTFIWVACGSMNDHKKAMVQMGLATCLVFVIIYRLQSENTWAHLCDHLMSSRIFTWEWFQTFMPASKIMRKTRLVLYSLSCIHVYLTSFILNWKMEIQVLSRKILNCIKNLRLTFYFPGAFFFPAIVIFLPLLVLALHLVCCPLHGRPWIWRFPL